MHINAATQGWLIEMSRQASARDDAAAEQVQASVQLFWQEPHAAKACLALKEMRK